MIALVDMDEVVADMGREWVTRLNEKHGTDVAWADVDDWDMTRFWPEVDREEIYAPLWDDDLYEWVDPIPGALEGVERLRDMGFKVLIVSSCICGSMIDQKSEWLVEYGFVEPDPHGGIPYDFIPCRQKEYVRGDLIVDDSPTTVERVVDHGTYGIIFPAPHNVNHGTPYPRPSGWGEVIEEVENVF